MGSDGHIKIYNYDKVKKIMLEINSTIPEKEHQFDFPGYILDWTVNNQRACLVYWDFGIGRKSPFGFLGHWQYDYEAMVSDAKQKGGIYKVRAKKFKEFWDRCDAEAVIVKDQQVWT